MFLLKEILSCILFMLFLGLWFYFFLNISEKKVWRIVNAIWGFGITILAFCFPVAGAFQISSSFGFKYVLFSSILFIGGLAFTKVTYWLAEKYVVMAEKFDKKREYKLNQKQ